MKDLKNQMEVKTKEKIEMTKELKADSNDKETSRKEHNDRLQSVRERKLQQLRYKFKFFESGWIVVNCVFNLSRVFFCTKKIN